MAIKSRSPQTKVAGGEVHTDLEGELIVTSIWTQIQGEILMHKIYPGFRQNSYSEETHIP